MAVQTQIQTRRGTAASWTSTNPTLAAGEIGFETDTGKFKIGNGSTAWVALAYSAGATAVTYLFNATAGQTTFSGADANSLTLAYTVGAEQVYLNGVLLVRTTDYTATNGTSIVLASGAVASDVLNVIAYSAMTITDTYTQAQANATFVQTAVDRAAGKNAVINGGMDIWQRGTSIAITTNTSAYTADRWFANPAGLNLATTVSRQATSDTTNLPNIQYALRYQRNSGQTGTAPCYFGQSFETVNSIPYAGKVVTFSFYARCGANYSPTSSYIQTQLQAGTSTDSFFIGGVTNVVNTNTVLTTTWQRFTYTSSTIPTNTTQIGVLFTYNPTGTAGANDYFEITGLQVEQGSVATAFTRNASTYQGELAACQRYYVRYSSDATNPLQSYGFGVARAATYALQTLSLPVEMRIAPTAIEYGGNLELWDGVNAATATTTLALDAVSSKYVRYTGNTASGLTQYRPYTLRAANTASAYVGFTSEL